MLAYLLMNIGVFAIIHGLQRQNGSEGFDLFAGLFQRSPFAAVAMTIFHPFACGHSGHGWFYRENQHFFIGAFVIEPGHYVLPSIMMATTVVSFVYYFRILQQMFFRKPEGDQKAKDTI
ncbi:hypothetical protein GCM10020331_023740 [Ectobacillus funiculus]